MNSLKLPLLQEREAALETCAYCPKLCRAACPVSDAEASETLTPWGKMGIAWYQARGSLELNSSYAATAWACTGCMACSAHCDHQNPVADTLLDARAESFSRGLAPAVMQRVADGAASRAERRRRAIAQLAAHPAVDAEAEQGLLLGCAYADDSDLSRAALDILSHLGQRVRLLSGCCGAIARAAGDAQQGARELEQLRAEVDGGQRLLVLDPGCMDTSPGGMRAAGATTLVEFVARRLDALKRLPELSASPHRWHDPCKLGRGLGVYDEPRAILTKILGEAPQEFSRRREEGTCSGAGELLPLTMPAASRRIADQRLADHAACGGGTVVTGCASSSRRFRAAGAPTEDLIALIARSLAAGAD